MTLRQSAVAVALALSRVALGQTYQRLGACPTLGCIFPPDQTDFLPGQYFDIRVEVHAPVNGSEAFNDGIPDKDFSLCIQQGEDGECTDVAAYFDKEEADLESWSFVYYEDLFAKDADSTTTVNVASKAYRALALNQPGEYIARLSYYEGAETVARWTVRESSTDAKAKNAIFFIGDGMTQAMITAARLIGHKSINGKYQSLMQMDTMEALGHQMTHSIDSFITDSANSATALYTGKKSTVNALNVYADSSEDPFDDPKFETMFELFKRIRGGPVGVVSTANIQDATPAAQCVHTRDRGQSAAIVYEFLHGASGLNETLEWPTSCEGPDVIFGGGAEYFLAGEDSWNGQDWYEEYAANGYQVVHTKSDLEGLSADQKALGIFNTGVMSKWLDRHVYPQNLENLKNSPTGDGTAATDPPGLKDMTLKAVDLLYHRSQANDTGFFMMAEAASIDKMMHVLDYDRALGELLELDDTIRATLAYLEELGIEDETLVVVTADHGHGFDVFGGADTQYLAAQSEDRSKRKAVGVYEESGLSGYQVEAGSNPKNSTVVVGPQGPNFPVQWNPRYAFAAGFGANPDRREGYTVNTTGPRRPAVGSPENEDEIVANPADQPRGFFVTGTVPPDYDQGVHSLVDVSVFASGPGSEQFRGVYNSPDIFFKFADILALGAH